MRSLANLEGTEALSEGAVFVMPRRRNEWADAVALWVTVAGWAAAAAKRFGRSWVVTPDGTIQASELLESARQRLLPRRTGFARHAPIWARTAAKDVALARRARRYRVDERIDWKGSDLKFVWQHHDIFHTAGRALATSRGCPLVSYVHSPQVWEARGWGVSRPGWGSLLERIGERPQLLSSDVVACVSDEVAAEITRMGVDRKRVIVSPMAVDADRFSPLVSGARVRQDLEVEASFVVGWVGTFRRFHALEVAIEAFAVLQRHAADARLLLVGDGAERSNIEALVSALGLGGTVLFAGAASPVELPEFVAAMDAAIVTSRAGQRFHYSPLKLREYLASGRAVVAPRVGDVERLVTDRIDALLYDAGDADGLAERLLELRDEVALRMRLGSAARDLIVETGTWDVQLERLLASAPYQDAVARLHRA